VIALLFHAQVEAAPPDGGPGGDGGGALPRPGPNGAAPNGNLTYEHQSLAGAEAIAAAGGGVATPVGGGGGGAVATRPVVKSEQEQLGRNDPCWCGSGKKFKRCHGA